jgi:hypothetical protein
VKRPSEPLSTSGVFLAFRASFVSLFVAMLELAGLQGRFCRAMPYSVSMSSLRRIEKTSLRLTAAERDEMDRRAREHGLSRTRYLVALGTGQGLPIKVADGEELKERVAVLERRLAEQQKGLALLGLTDGSAA